MRQQDVVDPSQFDIDLQAEVGQRLRRRLHHVLHLDALSGHAKEGVSDPLHLRCGPDTHSVFTGSVRTYTPHTPVPGSVPSER